MLMIYSCRIYDRAARIPPNSAHAMGRGARCVDISFASLFLDEATVRLWHSADDGGDVAFMSNESNKDLVVEGNAFDFLTDNGGKNYNLCHCTLSFYLAALLWGVLMGWSVFFLSFLFGSGFMTQYAA